MLITDAFIYQDMCFVACTGDEIKPGLCCKALIVNGKIYRVKRYEVRNSFSNHFQALFEVEGSELPPLGVCEIES